MVHCFMPLVEAFYHAADHASSTQKHDTIRILITIYAPDDVSSTGYAIYSHATEWLVIAGPPPPLQRQPSSSRQRLRGRRRSALAPAVLLIRVDTTRDGGRLAV